VVCVFVCLLVITMSCAKMAEPIEIQFGVRTRVGPGNRVLGAVKILPRKRLQLYFFFGGGVLGPS